MTRTIQLIISVALLVNIASGATLTVATASTASPTNSAFNTTPTVVLSIANTTDQAKWANIPAANVKYGGNLDGTKIFAYGYAVSGGSITTITTRTINATALAAATSDTTEASVIGDAQATGQTFAYTAGPIAQAVPGYLVLAYTGTDSNSAKQVYAVAWAGATNSGSKVALTAIATPTAVITTTGGTPTTTSTVYDYAVNGALYEDGVVYVYFVQTATATPTTGGTAGTPVSTDTVMVQGFYASNGTLFYTTQKTVAALSGTGTAAVCGLSNITNSTNIACVYSVGTGATSTVQYVTVARATGTAGTPVTAASSSTTGTASTAGFAAITYTPSGILGSNYASGGLISQYNSTGATPTATYGLSLYNTTGAAGLVSTPVVLPSSATGVVTANGFTYPSGYVIIGAYATGTTGGVTSYNYFAAPFYSNGSAVSDLKTIASSEGSYANFFVDVNGSAWFGVNSYEKSATSYTAAGTDVGTGNVVKGTVGKLYANLYPSSSTFGSILSTFFAFLAIVVATLFVF